jgi:hypothetical protein
VTPTRAPLPMHVLYIGSAGGDYPLWIGEALVNAGHRFSFLNCSPSFFELSPDSMAACEGRFLNLRAGPEDLLSEERVGPRRWIARILARVGVNLEPARQIRLRRWMDNLDIDVVLSHWGTVALPAIRCVKQVRPDLPIVHEFLSYPTDWHGAAERINSFYRSLIEDLAGRIYCSERMRAYFAERFKPGRSLETVRRSRYPRRAFPRKRRPHLPARDGPSVVCLATYDYLRMPGDVNDILPRLKRIADAGVNVYALRPPSGAASHARLHWFDRIDSVDGALATFATQFDACVVAYNLSDPRLDRTPFENSLPERFLYALVLGIPIVLPAGELLSCEAVVLDNEIGLTFQSEEDLANRLRDTRSMNRLTERAKAFSAAQTLEDDMPTLLEFLARSIEHYRRQALR